MEDDLTAPPGMDGLLRALDRKKREDAEWDAERERDRRRSNESAVKRREFLKHCQPATLLEYTAWMIGYLRRGGEPSHVYDYPFTQVAEWEWWVLSESPEIDLPALHGSASLHIIVPSGIGFRPNGIGHSTVYFMDGFSVVGHWTPVYTDMLPVLAGKL